MRAAIKLGTWLLLAVLALSGCSAMQALLQPDGAAQRPAQAPLPQAQNPRFTFYDSWASW